MSEEKLERNIDSGGSIIRKVAIASSLLVAAIGGLAYAKVLYFIAMSPEIGTHLIKNHFPMIVGFPASAYTAFIVVTLLRQSDGPIEFEALGFKFKGAAGQVMMWAVCFMAINISIKLLW